MKGFGYLFREGIRSAWNNRGMSIASIGILVSCLVITGVAFLFCQNLNAVVDKIGSENVVTVYLDLKLPDKEVKSVGNQIKKINNISKIAFYSKEEAIKEFDGQLGDIKNEFKGAENPLPDAYKITLKDLSKYDSTINSISKIKGVLKVGNKSGLAKSLTEIGNLVATVGFWIVFVLGMISLFIISTSIKTTMHSRRFEVSIMKSVGATNAFVRTPFVIEGLIIGVISGILSSVLIKFVYEGILGSVQTKYIASLEMISFNSVAVYVFAGMICAGALLGAIAAGISIRKYLNLEGNELLGW
ncbi:MAG: permease-like cell division protein FtsX [Acutalibacteraceae bacterium]|jgi:cell division transport system permease protein|nr:permease-like cell division protein FtsX [Acutalibacteraceae bacterium]